MCTYSRCYGPSGITGIISSYNLQSVSTSNHISSFSHLYTSVHHTLRDAFQFLLRFTHTQTVVSTSYHQETVFCLHSLPQIFHVIDGTRRGLLANHKQRRSFGVQDWVIHVTTTTTDASVRETQSHQSCYLLRQRHLVGKVGIQMNDSMT